MQKPVAGHAHRAVLDTNVLISAVVFGGRPGELVELARSGLVHAVTSLYILTEFRQVLTSPRFGVSAPSAEDLAVEIATFSEVVAVSPSRMRWTTDATDDPIVETALQGRCALIVTGDRHLLGLSIPGLAILSVADMLERVATEE